MIQKIDPIEEFFASCLDVDGSLHGDKVRYALACAYRQGFAEAKDQVPSLVHIRDQMQCSVSPPTPVFSKLQTEQMVAHVHERLFGKQES